MPSPTDNMKIAIIGCGPAGLSAACALHRQGHEIQMFERFEQPRAVGSGIILQPTGLAVLEAINLLPKIEQYGHPILTMSGQSMPSGKRVLNVDYAELGQGLHGLAVHRAALFDVLFERVRSLGIAIKTHTEINNLSWHNDHVHVIDTHRKQYGPFHLCIDASGANSALHAHAAIAPKKRMLKYGAIWGSLDWPNSGPDSGPNSGPNAGFRRHVLEQRYIAAHTMVGVLPIGTHQGVDREQVAFFWSLKSSEFKTWKAQGLDHWKDKVRSIWPETEVILNQITSAEQMSMAQYGHYTLAKPYGQRLIFIGDAAHATSPQLGQGANMGLLDAWAVSHAIEHSQSIAQAQTNYARIRRTHVRLFQLASLTLTSFYQSDSQVLAWLRDSFFDPFSRLPLARRLVAGLVTGLLAKPLQRMGLSAPGSAREKL